MRDAMANRMVPNSGVGRVDAEDGSPRRSAWQTEWHGTAELDAIVRIAASMVPVNINLIGRSLARRLPE